MVNKPLSLLAYCAILLVITTNVFASPKKADPRWLILSVFNDASVSAEILAHGEARAGHILAQTGIQVEWLNCPAGGSHIPDQFDQPSPCSHIGYPSHLSVRIVLAGRSVREDIFGEAYTDSEGKGTYIKLYYAHLAEPNAHLPLGEGELLGYVIAHEVGHLLLGTDSHSHQGIMQGRWEDPQLREAGKGNLQFTPSQAGLMREHLAGQEKKKESRRFDRQSGPVAHPFRGAGFPIHARISIVAGAVGAGRAKCDPPSSPNPQVWKARATAECMATWD